MKTIELSKGAFAIVDDADYERVNHYSWHLSSQGYAEGCTRKAEGQNRLYMARFILGVTDATKQVDHINGNPLDNRRSNLRICTAKENMRNRTSKNTNGFKGVHRQLKKFRAIIHKDYKQIYLGTFDTAEEAARAYDKAAREMFGEFAKLNFDKVA
jgi:hypothetical protein